MLPRLKERSRRARISGVGVQSSEELSLSGTTESVVADRRRIALSAVDLGDKDAEVLQVLLADCSTASHHDSTSLAGSL